VFPEVITRDVVLELGPTGTVEGPTVEDFFVTENVNCDPAFMISSYSLPDEFDQATFDCNAIGSLEGQLSPITSMGPFQSELSLLNVRLTIVDKLPPVMSCKDISIQLDDSGSASITPSDIDEGTTDNCNNFSLETSKSDFDCSNIGTNSVKLTATDNNGNSNECTVLVEVQKNIGPTALCKDATIQLDEEGLATLSIEQINNGSFDNCDIIQYTLTKTQFNCGDVGNSNILLIVEDGSGNTGDCQATVTVLGESLPNAICEDISVALDNDGNASITTDDVNDTPPIICDAFIGSLDQTSFDCSNIGDNTVTLTLSYESENISTCNATVEIKDETPPEVVCESFVAALSSDGFVGVDVNDLSVVASDNCGIKSLTLDRFIFSCNQIGEQAVVITVIDDSDNVTTCTSLVEVVENTAPIAVCQNITVALNEQDQASITANQIDNGSSDNCSITSRSLDKTNFDCSDVGNLTVLLTVEDGSGNTDDCQSTVTVIGERVPDAICMDFSVALDDIGNANITTDNINNTPPVSCLEITASLDKTSFDCSNLGDNTVTLTLTDPQNNTSTCTATVEVVDETPPVIECEERTSTNLNEDGLYPFGEELVLDLSEDNCGIASIVLDKTNFTCQQLDRTVPVTVTVTDHSGNISTCISLVEVEENILPTAICQDITIELDDQDQASITANQIDNGSFDNCSIVNIRVNKSSFDCNDIGDNTVRLFVVDKFELNGFCDATVTVIEAAASNASCTNFSVQLNENGEATITPQDISASSTNACNTVVLSLDITTFSCDDIGNNTVQLTATASDNSTTTCTATVAVQDNRAPVPDVSNLPDILTECSVNITSRPTASDNCHTSLEATTNDPLFYDSQGTYTITWNYDDGNGNTSTQTQRVIIEDNTAPTISTRDITIALDDFGTASINISDIEVSRDENCGIVSSILSQKDFDCSHLGQNTVSISLTDVGNNTTTETAT
ncbi:MAG: HYR domain-containing protein, partial [Bacteroidota bacterium]